MAASESYQQAVTGLVEAGWRIEDETADRVTLVDRTIGSPRTHLILAVLTIWWTMGLPNLLYGVYKYVADAERTVVWKEASTHADGSASSVTDPDLAREGG